MASNEHLLISSILNDSDMQAAIGQGLDAEKFGAYEEEWTWLWDYYNKYQKTPTDQLFRTQFPDFTLADVHDTPYLADEVRREYAHRQLTSLVRDTARKIADKKTDEALTYVSQGVLEIAASMGAVSDTDIFASSDEVIAAVLERIERREKYGSSGIRCGVPTIDECTGGFAPGDLSVFAARPGGKKSTTLQKFALEAALQGYTVQFNALEQGRSAVAMRVHALMSGMMGMEAYSSSDLMQGKVRDFGAYKTFVQDLADQVRGNLHIADNTRGKIGITELISQVERNQPDILFVDHITLLKMPGAGDWMDVAYLSNSLLTIANRYNIPVVTASQLNRADGASKSEPADLEGLARADAIGQDASLVVTMVSPTKSVLHGKIAKNRNGPSGAKFWVQARLDEGRYEEISKDRARDLQAEDDAEEGNL